MEEFINYTAAGHGLSTAQVAYEMWLDDQPLEGRREWEELSSAERTQWPCAENETEGMLPLPGLSLKFAMGCNDGPLSWTWSGLDTC